MIITCPKCQSQYNLNPAALGAGGRTVRCVSCGHTWLQMPEGYAVPEIPASPASEPVPSVTEKIDALLEKDNSTFEAILSSVEGVAPVAEPAEPQPETKTVTRRKPHELPVVTHNPLGVNAKAFGILVFLLFSFLTLTGLFLGRTVIVHHWPQMSLLYKKMGVEVKAPGEGLRISEFTAERRAEKGDKIISIQGKITNMSEYELSHPPLEVLVKDKDGKVIKEFDFKSNGTKLASGDVVPVTLQVADSPEEAMIVELRVKEE